MAQERIHNMAGLSSQFSKNFIMLHITGKARFLSRIFASNLLQTEEKKIAQKIDLFRQEKIKAEAHDWRQEYVCPSDRIACQMRYRSGYQDIAIQ